MKTRVPLILSPWCWLALASIAFDGLGIPVAVVNVVNGVNALRVLDFRAEGDDLPYPDPESDSPWPSDITIVSGFNSPTPTPNMPGITITSGFNGPTDITTRSGSISPPIHSSHGFTCPDNERCGSSTSGNLSSSFDTGSHRLSKGALAGWIVGGIALCALIAGLFWFLVRKIKAKRNRSSKGLAEGGTKDSIVEKGMGEKGKGAGKTSSPPGSTSDTSSEVTRESFISPYEGRPFEVKAV